MKKFIISLTLVVMAMVGHAQLNQGTIVTVLLQNRIESGKSDQPILVVSNDVRDASGKVVISQGTRVMANVDSKKRRGVGMPGMVDINLVSTMAVDGQSVPLSGSYSEEGERKIGKSAGLTAGMFFFIPPFNFCFLAIKGGDAEIGSGTMIQGSLLQSVSVK